MMQALTALLEQADVADSNRFSRDDLEQWDIEPDELPFLAAATAPQTITCPGCEEACLMRYQKQDGRAFIWCDRPQALGRINLQPRDLDFRRVDIQALAAWTANQLELAAPREMVAQRVYDLGTLENHTLFLLSGIEQDGARELLAESRIRNSRPFLITLAPAPEWVTIPTLWIGQLLQAAVPESALDRQRLLFTLQGNTTPEGNIFRREGDIWRVCYEGKQAFIKHSTGMVYLDYLLHHPNEEVPALVLQGLVNKTVLDAVPVDGGYAEYASLGGEPEIDDQARRDYESRIEYLKETQPDSPEIEALEAHLRSGTFHGRGKAFTANNERARVAVTKAIRGVIRTVKTDFPQVADFLTAYIKTGALCVCSKKVF